MKGSAEVDKIPSKLHVAIALFLTIGFMTTFFVLDSYSYEVNDDMAITALLKGLFGITPSSEGIFISPFLGSLLLASYKLFPAVSWFSLLLYIGLALAFFLGSLTILMTIRALGGQIAGLLGVASFLCVTAFEINFAAVTLLLWVTGCVFLSLSIRRNMPVNIWFWLASSHLAGAYLLRPSLLSIMIILAVPLFFALFLVGDRKRAIWVFSPLIVVLCLSLFSGIANREGGAYSDYLEFNKVRSDFLDTSQGNITPETTQALSAAGWSYEDYLVSRNVWFHDDSYFNTDKIKKFLRENAKKTTMFNIDDVRNGFINYKILWISISLWLLVFLLEKSFVEIKKIRKTDLFIFLFLLFFVILLMGIRFPQRVAVPCLLMLFLNLIFLFEDLRDNNLFIFKIVPPLVFIVFLIYSFHPYINEEIEYIQKLKNHKTYVDQSLNNVLQENGSDTIIVDVTPHVMANNYFPFHEDDVILKQRILPGGWLVGSPAYLDFLKKEGLGDRSTVVSMMIDNRRMVLRFCDSRQLPYSVYLKNVFLRHLRQRYTVPGSDRTIDLKILADHRQGDNRLIYLHLVTVPSNPVVTLP